MLSQLKTDLSTVLTDLANLEASRDRLYQLGAATWPAVSTQIQQVVLGFQPRVSSGGGISPPVIGVRTSDATKVCDLTTFDQRPVGSTSTGQRANLS
jgi:hypothetical protein